MIESRPALPTDFEDILDILRVCDLPCEDLTARHMNSFFVADQDGTLAGVVGLELLGESALLRSLAVKPEHREHGVGAELIGLAESGAADRGVQGLYLLTTTAQGYFSKHSYQAIERDAAPPEIQATTEFATLCPDTSVCMTKKLVSDI